VQAVISESERQELKEKASQLGLSESKLVGLYIRKGMEGDDTLRLAKLERLIKQLKEVFGD